MSVIVTPPAATEMERPLALRSSVISSCSDRGLAELIREIRGIDNVRLVDLFVLRSLDILEIDMELEARDQPCLDPRETPFADQVRTTTQILAQDANLPRLVDWVGRQFHAANAGVPENEQSRIAAMATYFPDITSRSKEYRELAIHALANTVRLGLELRDVVTPMARDANSRPVIVELVCGTILDQCECAECRRDRENRIDFVMVATDPSKVRLLCDSLGEVCGEVERTHPGRTDWALAMELEPGPTYVLRNIEQIAEVFTELQTARRNRPAPATMARHIGLNADIAHASIAGVPARTARTPDGKVIRGLDEFADRIVHGHICDHPGMHTRDQVPGVWKPVDRGDNEYRPYLELLAAVGAAPPRQSGLPFSNTVALELEGCNRIGWVHESIVALKQLLS